MNILVLIFMIVLIIRFGQRCIFLGLFGLLVNAWLLAILIAAPAPVEFSEFRQSSQFIGAVVLLTLVLLRTVPPWLAWRVCRPLKLSFLGRFCFWFTLGAKARELENFADLLNASCGIPPGSPPVEKSGVKEKIQRFLKVKNNPRPLVVDAGTIMALALAAEFQGDSQQARRQLQAFALCPPGMKIPRMLRRLAFEELAWCSATRGDWSSVRYYARRGGRRGTLLLRWLADAALTGRVHRFRLWFAWLVAPARGRTLALVQDALRRTEAPFTPQSALPVPEESLRGTHLRLLRQAADGLPVSMTTVFALARRWDGEFNHRRAEMLLQRGLALGARDVLGIAARIHESVLDELEELAVVADGAMPADMVLTLKDEKPSGAAQLALRLKNRMYDDISRVQRLFREQIKEAALTDEAILQSWEQWLALQEAVAWCQCLLGPEELATLWYNGLQTDAWNGACDLSKACGHRVAWISILQCYWVAEIAEQVGDEEAKTTNQKNMKLCGYRPPFLLQRLLIGLTLFLPRRWKGAGEKKRFCCVIFR